MKNLLLSVIIGAVCFPSWSQTGRTLSIQLHTHKDLNSNGTLIQINQEGSGGVLRFLSSESPLHVAGIEGRKVYLSLLNFDCVDAKDREVKMSKNDTTHLLICIRKTKSNKRCCKSNDESIKLEMKYRREGYDCTEKE